MWVCRFAGYLFLVCLKGKQHESHIFRVTYFETNQCMNDCASCGTFTCNNNAAASIPNRAVRGMSASLYFRLWLFFEHDLLLAKLNRVSLRWVLHWGSKWTDLCVRKAKKQTLDNSNYPQTSQLGILQFPFNMGFCVQTTLQPGVLLSNYPSTWNLALSNYPS